MLVGNGGPSSFDSDDELACVGNEFAAAKEYEVLQRIGGGTFGEVGASAVAADCAGHRERRTTASIRVSVSCMLKPIAHAI